MSERTELPMQDELCETCRWWSVLKASDEAYGTCRRYPPVLADHVVKFEEENEDPDAKKEENAEQRMWKCLYGVNPWIQPTTFGDDWCGEWKAKT